MTLQEAKDLLSKNNIYFDICKFESEAEYWQHITLYPYTKYAKNCKVIALIIMSNNGKKNIELQFNAIENEFRFEELHFGDYSFEMFDYNEEMLANDLLDRIQDIQCGNFTIIVANNLKSESWIGDACFDLNDDDLFGKPGFERAMKRIQKPKGLISKLLKSGKQYEIYDWNSYQCIIK